jgi:uncharacterized membrane protein
MWGRLLPLIPEDVQRAVSRDGRATLSSLWASKTLPWLIIGLGITLRAAQYLANRSLWFDESILALNILQRSFAQLLSPLNDEQVAPIGFLMAEKLAIVYLGNSEYALRLFPLLAGIVALPLFYMMARSCLPPLATLIGLTLFAFSGFLIYFSSEVKQYSSDLAIALFLCFLALRYVEQETSSRRDTLILGLSGAIAIWFSHPVIFILLGIGVSLVFFQSEHKTWRDLGPISLLGILWIVSFVTVYVACYRQVDTGRLTDYWQKSFMPFPPRSLADVKWVGAAFMELLARPLALRPTTIVMAVLAFSVGCATIFAENRTKAFILLSPLFFTLVASALHQFPFSGRLLLFIAPAILICVASGIFQVLKYTGKFSLILKCVMIISIVIPSIQASVYHLFKNPILREEITPVLSYLQKHWQEGDTLYLYYGSIPAFRYYQERYGFAHVPHIEGVNSRSNWRNYLDDLEKLRGRQRVWILFSHVHRNRGIDERILMLDHLDQLGTRLDFIKVHGAEAYLYDM